MVVETRFIMRGYVGCTIFPFVFIRKGLKNKDVIINHEKIHLRQQKELLVIPFFIIYILNYTVNIVLYRNLDKAYRNIIFEREAYQNEKNMDYLK